METLSVNLKLEAINPPSPQNALPRCSVPPVPPDNDERPGLPGQAQFAGPPRVTDSLSVALAGEPRLLRAAPAEAPLTRVETGVTIHLIGTGWSSATT